MAEAKHCLTLNVFCWRVEKICQQHHQTSIRTKKQHLIMVKKVLHYLSDKFSTHVLRFTYILLNLFLISIVHYVLAFSISILLHAQIEKKFSIFNNTGANTHISWWLWNHHEWWSTFHTFWFGQQEQFSVLSALQYVWHKASTSVIWVMVSFNQCRQCECFECSKKVSVWNHVVKSLLHFIIFTV